MKNRAFRKDKGDEKMTQYIAAYTLGFGHPTIDDKDLKSAARHAVTHLHALCQPVNGSCRSEGQFKLGDAFRSAGFTKNLGAFGLLLYQLGVMQRLRKTGSGQQFRFFVIDPDYFDMLVTDESVELAAQTVQERGRMVSELSVLKRRVTKLQEATVSASPVVAPPDEAPVDPELLESLAEAATVTEALRAEIADLKVTLLERENQILLLSANRPTPQAVADVLMAKIRGE